MNSTTRFKIFANLYKDSVTLMQLGAQLRERDGIAEASCLMATPANLAQLHDADLSIDTQASPSDLLVVVRGEPAACDEAIEAADAMLQAQGASGGGGAEAFSIPLTSLALAVESNPGADLALISVPGDYAAAEAMKAIALGLHVMVFSDNVSIAEERAIKTAARAQGPAGDGPRLRHGDRQRRPARLRQRRAPRRHRPRRRIGHRPAGSHLPDPQPRRRHLAGARHRRPRSQGRDRRHHDAAGARRPGGRPPDPRRRPDLQAAGAGDRPADRGRGGRGGQARRRPLPRRRTRAAARRDSRRHFVATRRRRRRRPRSRRAGSGRVVDPGRRRGRRRRTVRDDDGRRAEVGSRAVHRRNVLLRGAAGVHRARPAVPIECAGQGRAAVRRSLRRPRLPRPGRRRLHARPSRIR